MHSFINLFIPTSVLGLYTKDTLQFSPQLVLLSDCLLKVSLLNVTSAWVFFSLVSSSESTQEKRKRKIRDGGGRVDRKEDAKKKKKKSQRPNYFISIPITNTQVKKTKNAIHN